MIVLEYRDERHFLKLHSLNDDSECLPADNLYNLSHNLSDENNLDQLTYVQAMTLWSGLLSELVEIHTREAGTYPYTKEQFTSLVNFYTQSDTPILSELVNSSLKIELKNIS